MRNIGFTKGIVVGCIFVAFTLFASSYYVKEQKKEIVAAIKLNVVEQEKTLSNIAEITDRNGADATLESIVLDCSDSNRNKFDELLNRLAELNTAELLDIESLFNDCGRFFSERKAVMVLRMHREFEVYKQLIELLQIVDNAISVTEYKLSEWEQLVTLEQSRSKLFESQATVQHNIIKALQRGESVGSESMNEMLSEAQNINQQAIVVNQQIDALRAKLLDI